MEKLPQNYRCKLRHSVFFEQKEATKRNRPRRCGAKGRFFKEKAPQKPFAKGCSDPHKIHALHSASLLYVEAGYYTFSNHLSKSFSVIRPS